MYDVKPNLIIGFHGCERKIRDQLLLNPNDYKISRSIDEQRDSGLILLFEGGHYLGDHGRD